VSYDRKRKRRAAVVRVLLPVARVVRQVVRVVRPLYVHFSSERCDSRLSLDARPDARP
jgi:hypothetical protein